MKRPLFAPPRAVRGERHAVVPLCVDLDGTLIKTDLLWESVLALVRRNPLYIVLVVAWLLKGKAHLKDAVARRVAIEPGRLPYQPQVIELLNKEHRNGRRLVLATAASSCLANRVAAYLGVFSDVIASDRTTNLDGKRKLAVLVDRFGEKGFSYAGNTSTDLDIWAHAHDAIVVTARPGLIKHVRRMLPFCHHIEAGRLSPALFVKALRLHQWTKNLLIFVPLLTSHRVTSLPLVTRAFAAFVAFSLVASSAYVLNDLLDLDADRQDSKKRHRPFASGDLSLPLGLTLIPVLLAAGLAAAVPFGGFFLSLLLLYFILTIGYSFCLKRFIFVDVVTLAGLYALRIEVGAAAVGVEISKWLLLFALFMFFSLALVKRYSELRKVVISHQDQGVVAGRSYRSADLQCISTLGIASGLTAVLVVALYVNGSNVTELYRNPDLLWLMCPLMLYWISRIWLMTVRGAIDEDPVVFALRDGGSYVVGALTALIMFWAT